MEDNTIYFKRKMYDTMLKWKSGRNGDTALLIQGARRIGKSTIAEEFARNEYKKDSDIDIAIFTSREPQEFYLLINEISEVTFEYSVKYDVILSPVFQNTNNFKRMIKAVPYFQSIQREGMAVE